LKSVDHSEYWKVEQWVKMMAEEKGDLKDDCLADLSDKESVDSKAGK
jgi:hypothetical protein